ncbi:MAG: NADP-dependent malic enzyme [Chitinophagales bacterium]|nr:NADP-dependent malic enzyme [Chitinophagales bacterium]MCZ2393344.1 NADP-dependent malic enzyme [Chitinophagales bacterium]
MKDYSRESLSLHEKLRGKISVELKTELETKEDMTLCYSPGVAEPCMQIANDPDKAWTLTCKGNMVAVLTDGTAVLGLGNIGPAAAMPVMEGKAMLFKRFGGVDAFPICLDTQDTEEIIRTVRLIAPGFGGINLEDISSPRCFEIEERLQDLGIPVFHDDQHGTAIVTIAGLINACKLLNKEIKDLKVVINGAGAAGIAIANLLNGKDLDPDVFTPVKEIIICDTKGIIHKDRKDLNSFKTSLLTYSNPKNTKGTVRDAIKDADVFVGVSSENILIPADIRTMAKNPIIFALANPNPEITPELAYEGGAGVVGTGRSDLPNQVNNVLAFPGIFKGALEIRATKITPRMKLAAAHAIANAVGEISRDHIIPSSLNLGIADKVAEAVKEAWLQELEIAQLMEVVNHPL